MLTSPFFVTFASATQFHIYLPWDQGPSRPVKHSVLNVNFLAAFNQEEDLVGAFSVIVTTDGSYAALVASVVRWRGGEVATPQQITIIRNTQTSPARHSPGATIHQYTSAPGIMYQGINSSRNNNALRPM